MVEELTSKQKEALNQILLFIKGFNLSTTLIAEAIGMNRPTLANKIIAFRAAYAGEQTTIRNKFSQEDFQKLHLFLRNFEASLKQHVAKVEKALA